MQSGRERKTKSKKDKGGPRQRKQQAAEDAADPMSGESGWSSALDPDYGSSKYARKGRDKHKKSGRNRVDPGAFEEVDLGVSTPAIFAAARLPWDVSERCWLAMDCL